MKTKERILDAAVTLFNQRGWVNVTLRDISASLNISYGNATYYFSTKEKLLETIYAAYEMELLNLGKTIVPGADVFFNLLKAPQATFALSLKYRFLFVDFLELQRQFPAFMVGVNEKQELRKANWKTHLVDLQKQGILRADLNEAMLDFIMEMSGMVRTFFFLKVLDSGHDFTELEAAYVWQVNAVLWPYLTQKGLDKAHQGAFFT